ncbi:MAG: helix-turn-helix domain-containing protein, partial [bacterium]
MPTRKQQQVDTQWFQERLRERDVSQRRLAKMLSLDPSALSLMFRGRRKMTTVEAAELSRILGVPLDEVMLHAGATGAQPVTTIPLVYSIDDQGELHAKRPGERVHALGDLPEAAVAARNEDRHSAYFGWTYFYVPRPNIPIEAIGKKCIVQIPNWMNVEFLNRVKKEDRESQGIFSDCIPYYYFE